MTRLASPGFLIQHIKKFAASFVQEYEGRTWATRKRPWVERLATAWLVLRILDKTPKFIATLWRTVTGQLPPAARGLLLLAVCSSAGIEVEPAGGDFR